MYGPGGGPGWSLLPVLVGLGSCACTGTTVSLHCWAGGCVVVVVPAQLYHCTAGLVAG